MKNYLAPGRAFDIVAPANVVSGQPLLVGTIVGFCGADALQNAKVAFWVVGEWSVTKVGSQAWTVGAAIYWDDSAKNFTTTVGSNTKCGVAIAAVGAGSGETTGKIRLNGVW